MIKLQSIFGDTWAFIHCPKTSGTNFRSIVSQYYTIGNCVDVVNSQKINLKIIPFLQKEIIKTDKLLEDLNFSDYEKEEVKKNREDFMFHTLYHCPLWVWQKSGEMNGNEKVMTICRNPFTKFVSYYYYTMDYLNLYFDLTQPTIYDFIKNEKINQIVKIIDPHSNYLINQVDYLIDMNENIVCDRFYKLEEDLNLLEKDFDLKNINEFRYNTAPYEKNYGEIYTDELIEFVQETYKKDFEYFGYDKKPFW
jgi:hypothetical protein